MPSLTYGVATPERVNLELPLAGVGSRAMAWLIDAGLLFSVWVVGYFLFSLIVANPLDVVLGLSQAIKLVGGLAAFASLFVYWTALEVLWEGQTVGKRLVGVRVVRADGAPVTMLESATRNLMRIVDFLPVCYPVGLMTMLVDPRHRRLGDIVAGTLLVRDEHIDLSRYTEGDTASLMVLSVADAELVSGYLARFEALEPAARGAVGQRLAARLGVETTGDAAAVRDRLGALLSGKGSSALSSFVVAHRSDWQALETLVAQLRARTLRYADLARLDRLYRRASADLARAGKLGAGTDVHRYLNHLCGKAYAAIYRARGDRLLAVWRFYSVEFPRAVRETMPYTRVAAGLLALGVVLGATTVALAPGGAAVVLDPQLLAFLERRELWTDSALEAHTPAEMATLIFTNNLKVTFGAFALGITLGVGTAALALYNGFHLGALVTACAQHGLLQGILGFMAAHGPVELSSICITVGAGLVMGHALVEPGERSRAQWLKERSALAVKLVVGCAPFLVAIGVVEGYVSPGAFFPWPLKVVTGVLTFAAFWRFVGSVPNRR